MKASEFESVYRAWHGPVRGYFYNRTQDLGLAQDLAADTFMRAWRAWDRVDNITDIRAWLFAIAGRLFIDHLRRKPSQPALPLDHAWLDTSGLCVDWTDRVETRLDLERLWPRLNPMHRAVIRLIYVDGYTYDETAQRLGIPRGTARRRVNLARAAMRRTMRE